MEPAEDMVFAALFNTFTTPPPPQRERDKRHHYGESGEDWPRKEECTEFEAAWRASLVDEEV